MSTPPSHPELVVGIGASAGGLRALESFFQAMPPDAGCAYVVIQHLSPDFKSLMDDLLARHTAMRIHRVEDGMPLERDCIYLIPPRKLMTVQRGQLRLTDREANRQLEFPINVFLESLAADCGGRGIAVILSGTGTDGTHGVRAVHDAGGLVIVQAPESADFNGMPRSALNTGLADYILPPERMPEAVNTFARYPQLRMMLNSHPMTPHEAASSFAPVLDHLRRSCGIDFGAYKLPTVQRRIHRRMGFLRQTDVEKYARLLGEQPEELDELYRDLLIGVTEFMRDPEAFETLAREVLPDLFRKPGRDEVRVWVAGCATGEEAYSVAILLDEAARAAGFSGRCTVFATDMHRDSLAAASAGIYERARLEHLGLDRIARHFREESEGLYRVVPDLRQRILFSPHNLICDPPFTKLDLITCRNVLIYFQPPAQEQVLGCFHYALRPGGTLFLGSSEGLGVHEAGFSTLSGRHKLYAKSSDSGAPPAEIRPLSPLRNPRLPPAVPVVTGNVAVNRPLLQAYDFLLKESVPASLLVTESGEIVQFFEQASRYLLVPEGRAHDNLFNRTAGDLRLVLSSLLPKAFRTGETGQARGIRLGEGEAAQLVDVEIRPIPDERNGTTLAQIVFDRPRRAPAAVAAEADAGADFTSRDALDGRVHELELELKTAKENLQATVEELQTSNEELQATNEELLAANEELQSTNEELHSVNEELYTVNAEFERKNNELKLVGEDLHNLLSSTDVATLFLDRHLRIRRFTPTIARIFNLLPQDIGRPLEHLAYQLEGEPDLPQLLQQVLTEGVAVEREIRSRENTWLFQRVLPFRTAEGKTDGVVITFTDISPIKAVQDKLNLAMEFSRMVWWEWNLVDESLTTHTGGQSIFGYAGAVITMSSGEWQQLVHPEYLERVRTALERCLHGDASRWECQHRFLTADRQWRWVVNKGKVAARDTQGKAVRMLGTTQDVHDRCLAEQEIKKLNLALERSPIMVMITDLEGRIEYVNQHFTDVTGYTPADVIGQNPRILKSGEQNETTFREMWQTLRRGETWQGEVYNRRKDGRCFWERATMAPLRDAAGRVTHYVALKEETTPSRSGDDEQTRMEEQLSQVQKMETLGALAGGIAHDFNNILTAIIGHTELATELAPPPHPAAASLQQVRQASRRASELVQRILSFSHRGPSHREKINLAALVGEVLSLLRASIPSTVKVELSLGGSELAVLANPTDLQQVVLNLGSNAAHAMRERGGTLTIGLEPRRLGTPLKAVAGTLDAGDYLCLRVTDTGTGIPPPVLARMFEPFFTTKPSGEGTGLGLSIILGIVLAHGGAIDVQTELGRGTVFEVLLPAVPADLAGDGQDEPLRISGRGQRLAFIDDEPAITLMADLGLTRHGFAPTTFPNALGLLENLAAGGAPFDLIVTDHTMPEMTGLEMIRRLRANGCRTPVIILSGNARYVSAEDLRDLGNVQFMPKPFDLASLLERIAVMLALET
ncbi:MAG: hypothetical protein B9S34_14815 [Opitutia bacterium Tous-C1TDCM]|nr:MAG: hypothetical protein B9S34_14815 [Opitutae bacterium Tous-C1TDCM]